MAPRAREEKEEEQDENYLGTKSESDQHEEEKHRPQLRDGHDAECCRIDDEGQARAWCSHLADLNTHLVGQEPQHGKNYHSNKNGRRAVSDSDHECIPEVNKDIE